MRPALVLTGAPVLVAIFALPVLAEGGPKQAEIDAFVAAIKAAGCVVNAQNADAIITASGIPAEVAAAVSQRLEDEGKIVLGADKTLTLAPELCQ